MMKSFRILLALCTVLTLSSCIEDDSLPEHLGEFNPEYVKKLRAEKDELFHGEQSPLPMTMKRNFKGLKYYEPTDDYIFVAEFAPFPSPDTIQVQTSISNQVRPMLRYGQFAFSVKETTYNLVAFKSLDPGAEENQLFVPFKDATNGKETYETGRYLDIEENAGSTEYALDFNSAYNPYCAYNPGYSCPLVPKYNILPIEIHAGEKKFFNY